MPWVREFIPNTFGELIMVPKRITVGDVNHPQALFSLWTDQERAKIGIFPAEFDTSADGPFKIRTGSIATWMKTKTNGVWVIVVTFGKLPRGDFVAMLRARGRELVLNEMTERANAAWVTYKEGVRTRGIEILQAFDADQPIDLQTGAINGSGGWPA